MNFNKHFELRGKHAIFSASSWRWLNDDHDALVKRLCSQYAQSVGTILHEVAYNHIKYRTKMSRYDKKHIILELLSNGVPGIVVDALDIDGIFENLMAYVNDCIGFKMEPEVILYYSPNFFGTADAIAYSERDRFLRIHDLKTGVSPTHIEQLLIYAALFCLEYRIKPTDIDTELRIYQSSDVLIYNPDPREIVDIMDKIESNDNFLIKIMEEV